jgi:hypothetical protein
MQQQQHHSVKDLAVVLLLLLIVVEGLIALDFFHNLYSLHVLFMRTLLGNPVMQFGADLLRFMFDVLTLSNALKMADIMSLLVIHCLNISSSSQC